jgi:hypothetical protein
MVALSLLRAVHGLPNVSHWVCVFDRDSIYRYDELYMSEKAQCLPWLVQKQDAQNGVTAKEKEVV